MSQTGRIRTIDHLHVHSPRYIAHNRPSTQLVTLEALLNDNYFKNLNISTNVELVLLTLNHLRRTEQKGYENHAANLSRTQDKVGKLQTRKRLV